MTKHPHLLGILFIVVGTGGPGIAAGWHLTQTLNGADIDMAIRCGMREIACEEPVLDRLVLSYFSVQITTPLDRVFSAAREAQKRQLEFSRADVTLEMLDPTITVYAWDADPSIESVRNIKHVVLSPEGTTEVIQPAKFESVSFDRQKLDGLSFRHIAQKATFYVWDLPPGDFDVVLITEDGSDRRIRVRGKYRQNLDRWCGRTPK